MVDLYLSFLAGFFGGVHCAGMCGPVVAACSMNYTKGWKERALLHLCYNSGRVYTYALLGAVAGFTGSFLEIRSTLHLFAVTIKLLSSLFIIGIGLSIAGLIPQLFKEKVPEIFNKVFHILLTSPSKLLLLGFLMGFLPCGLVYALLLKSATSGSMSKGAFIMAAFGIGTAPSLLFAGFFSDTLKMKTKESFIKIAGMAIAALGILTLIRELKH